MHMRNITKLHGLLNLDQIMQDLQLSLLNNFKQIQLAFLFT